MLEIKLICNGYALYPPTLHKFCLNMFYVVDFFFFKVDIWHEIMSDCKRSIFG